MALKFSKMSCDELPDVKDYFDRYWRKNHIFFQKPEIMDWQHKDGDEYCLALCREETTHEILGVCGYIANRLYDSALSANNVVYFTNWSIREDCGIAGLGLMLQQYIEKIEDAVCYGTVGLRPYTLPMYQARGYEIGELKLFRFDLPYRLNTTYSSINNEVSYRELCKQDLGVVSNLGGNTSKAPMKSQDYFIEKYLNHPAYQYDVFMLSLKNQTEGLIALRQDFTQGDCFYCVDYQGNSDTFSLLSDFFSSFLMERGGSKIFLYQHGMEASRLRSVGFVPCHLGDSPMNFDSLHFAIKSSIPVGLFMGDGDLDRPR